MIPTLAYITWNVDPILFEIGPVSIRWYGLLWAVGLYLNYLIQVKLYKNEGSPDDWADKIFLWMTVGVIVGARLGHCWFYEWHLTDDPIQIFAWTINYRNPYIEHPLWLIKVWEGGLSSHGGAVGVITAAILLEKYQFSKNKKIKTSVIWILDKLVIGICVTATLIRFGNLMNSEIYGNPTTMPWGFIFLRDPQVPIGADGQPLPCHPTQIYEMMYCIFAFVVTWLMYWKGQCYKKEGLILGTFLVIIFLTRFGLEFMKLDQEAFEAGMILNMGQWLSIPFIIWGAYLIWKALKK